MNHLSEAVATADQTSKDEQVQNKRKSLRNKNQLKFLSQPTRTIATTINIKPYTESIYGA